MRRAPGRASHGAAAIASVGLGSLAQIAAPIGALLTLQAREFGEFSLLYLLFAWALSLQLSICTEPYARHRLAHGHSDDQQRMLRASSTTIALVMGLACAIGAVLLWGSATLVAATALAVFGTVVRNGARYQYVVERGLAATLRGDLAFVIAFAVALVLLLRSTDHLTAVMLAWAAGATATLVVANPPRWPGTVLGSWVTEHRATIAPLLRESLVLDASSIGGAYVVAPLLSIHGFGVYRAVSNVATPVRLATEALRPLAARSLSPRGQRLLLFAVVVLGVVTGAAAALAVLLVDRAGVDLGVVNDLAPYAVPTGVFVGASLVGALLYYQARVHASARDLWRGRLWQSGTALLGPLAGAVLGGLTGAIVGTAVATAFGAAVWWWLARAAIRTSGSHPSPNVATGPPSAQS